MTNDVCDVISCQLQKQNFFFKLLQASTSHPLLAENLGTYKRHTFSEEAEISSMKMFECILIDLNQSKGIDTNFQ
jgi:hypothetical protein